MKAELKANYREAKTPSGFTLLEVMISMAISSVLIIGLVGLLNFNFVYQNQQELRANAMDAMARETEKLRRQFIFTVDPYSIKVADNRTPDNPNDDTTGTLHVKLYDRHGTQLTVAPVTEDVIRVVMRVEWRGRGRMHANLYHEELVSYLIP